MSNQSGGENSYLPTAFQIGAVDLISDQTVNGAKTFNWLHGDSKFGVGAINPAILDCYWTVSSRTVPFAGSIPVLRGDGTGFFGGFGAIANGLYLFADVGVDVALTMQGGVQQQIIKMDEITGEVFRTSLTFQPTFWDCDFYAPNLVKTDSSVGNVVTENRIRRSTDLTTLWTPNLNTTVTATSIATTFTGWLSPLIGRAFSEYGKNYTYLIKCYGVYANQEVNLRMTDSGGTKADVKVLIPLGVETIIQVRTTEPTISAGNIYISEDVDNQSAPFTGQFPYELNVTEVTVREAKPYGVGIFSDSLMHAQENLVDYQANSFGDVYATDAEIDYYKLTTASARSTWITAQMEAWAVSSDYYQFPVLILSGGTNDINFYEIDGKTEDEIWTDIEEMVLTAKKISNKVLFVKLAEDFAWNGIFL